MPRIAFLIDKPSFSAQSEGRILTGYEENFLLEKCVRAGLIKSDILVCTAASLKPCDVVVTLGDAMLTHVTGKKSIWKWHLSPLSRLVDDGKCVPTFDFTQIWKDWSLGLYLEMAVKKAANNATPGPWIRKEERYVLGPSPDEAIARLEALLEQPPEYFSLDIETGRNQINTFGVAWSGSDAMAIKVLPGDMPAAAFHKLWRTIAALCESDVPKVMQNGIYERMYLSRYGIRVNNFKHDTMCAQKFLWPELEKGLDNVGRIYTMEPYWKDDGRVASEEGKQKDWGNIRDWNAHLTYNCRDTSNTLIAALAQQADLKARNLKQLFDMYLCRLYDPVYEMGARGFPLNTEKQTALITEYEARSKSLVAQLSKEINPRSPKAKLTLLKEKGYVIPTKRATGKESTDELSLKKLRLKYPDDKDLQILLEVAAIEKALSSYLRVRTLPDKMVRFMLDPHGTETGRMSCSNDPWSGGFNAQTMNDYTKSMLSWEESNEETDQSPRQEASAPEMVATISSEVDGKNVRRLVRKTCSRVFMEFDLEQAETRFVAYDACEETLLGMIERREDIHKYVAAEIYQKPMADVTHEERQLGKKSGHGANYSMGVTTFQDSCLKEMDLVLDRKMATRVLESYHKLFPGIRRWHAKIRDQVYRERKLTNPLGRFRFFYGRTDDNTYREAYAYRPQSTVPDIVNHLMLALWDKRSAGEVDFWQHMQCHDSITISCFASQAQQIAEFALDTKRWHPEIILPAGKLIIPVSGKYGRNLGAMEKFKWA